jgi:2-polyprenyl-3-methyl-5-hydroxy-6-metoxy-1,4-benzoquinol methylase
MSVARTDLVSVPICNLCGSSECSRSFSRDEWQIRICAKCGLGRTDPRPAAQSLQECYGADYWQSGFQGEQYTPKEVRHLLRRYGRRAGYLKRFKRRGSLLEIGTGFGFFLESARRRGYEVRGLEYSSWVAEKARSMFGLPIENAGVADFNPGPVKYDLVVAWHVLEHLTNPLEAMQSIRDWLRDDGIFAVEVPNCGSVDADRLGDAWEGWTAPHHLWHFTPQALQRMLEKAGFRVVGTKYGRSTYIRHRLKRYPVLGWFRCLVDCWYKGTWVRMVAVPK